MAEQIRQKKLSPVELVEAHLARIEKLNPKLNAFVQVDAEGARRQARAAEEAVTRGEKLGPLHGVPISIKSSIEVTGMQVRSRHQASSGLRGRAGCAAGLASAQRGRDHSGHDQHAGTANGVGDGQSSLRSHQQSLGSVANSRRFEWRRSRGDCAGCSAGGVGSDGGGSIRVPAHFSGICGLKPTPGRIPATGHFPTSVGPFALIGVVGPMARTVSDLKVLFEVMQGPDDGDPSAAPVPVRWPSRDDLKKLRIGYFEDDGRTPVTAETRAAVRTAAEALKRAGFEVEPFRPEGLEQARQLWWQLFGIAGGMLLRPMTKGREADLSPMLKQISSWVAAEPPHSGQTLLDTWIMRDVVRMQVFSEMREYPILLCPVASIPAFRHGERSWEIDGKTVQYLDAWSYTEWFNLLGTPAVAVPFGRSNEGLPIGVQIVARPWEEELVLAVAAELEAQRGEWQAPDI